MKNVVKIPFSEIESIPQLIKDFLAQKISGAESKVYSQENIKDQIASKAISFSPEKRAVIASVLQKQHSESNLTDKQKNNLISLSDDYTFTVTTGHQLNLFTGPVFFIYKILQTIKLAEDLNNKFPDSKIVPIFWMATEDHDFEEIDHFKTADNYYEIKGKSGGAVGRITVEDTQFITRFQEELKDSIFGTELILLMKKAYKVGNTLAQATRIIVQELFSEYGLLIIDGDDVQLKEEMISLFTEELIHQSLFKHSKVNIEALSDQYGKVQVNPREINLFYLNETRDRIEFGDNKYLIVDQNRTFTETELLNELKLHPEKFSPNALLRPVFQETVLPNLAYIGGNAEIMYWLELLNYFDQIKLPFPILIPRNSMLMVKEKTLSKLPALHLNITDFFKNFAEVTKNTLLENNEILPHLISQKELLKNNFDHLKEIAKITDPTFGNLVEAEETRQLKSFDRMKKRLLRAERIKQSEKLERIQRLFLEVHPGKTWQERNYNFSVFYADLGKDWLYNCYEEIELDEPELIIFSV